MTNIAKGRVEFLQDCIVNAIKNAIEDRDLTVQQVRKIFGDKVFSDPVISSIIPTIKHPVPEYKYSLEEGSIKVVKCEFFSDNMIMVGPYLYGVLSGEISPEEETKRKMEKLEETVKIIKEMIHGSD